MDNDYISLEDIHRWDSQLLQLASYEVTGGLMVVPSSIDESMDLQKEISKILVNLKIPLLDLE